MTLVQNIIKGHATFAWLLDIVIISQLHVPGQLVAYTVESA